MDLETVSPLGRYVVVGEDRLSEYRLTFDSLSSLKSR